MSIFNHERTISPSNVEQILPALYWNGPNLQIASFVFGLSGAYH